MMCPTGYYPAPYTLAENPRRSVIDLVSHGDRIEENQGFMDGLLVVLWACDVVILGIN